MADYSQFPTCVHNWKFHIDADSCGGGAKGNSMFLCEKCRICITLNEKYTLDTFAIQKETSETIKRQSLTSMIAMLISAGILIVTCLIFLFGENYLNIS